MDHLTNAINALELAITPSTETIIRGMIAQCIQMRELASHAPTSVVADVITSDQTTIDAPTPDLIDIARNIIREQILEFCCNANVNAIVAIASSDCTEIDPVALSNHETSVSTRETVNFTLNDMITKLTHEDYHRHLHNFCTHFDLKAKMRRCIAFHKMQWAPVEINRVEASYTISTAVDTFVQSLSV